MTTTQKLAIAAACLVTIAFRLNLPWIPNLGTMVVLSLLCGCACKSWWGLAIPIGIRVLTDVVLEMKTGYGFFASWPFDYSAYVLIAVLGSRLNSKSALQVGGGTLASVAIYYLVSNSGVWFVGNGVTYPDTAAGLLLCLQMGLPFAKATVVGNLLAAPVFFGTWALATSISANESSSPQRTAGETASDQS